MDLSNPIKVSRCLLFTNLFKISDLLKYFLNNHWHPQFSSTPPQADIPDAGPGNTVPRAQQVPSTTILHVTVVPVFDYLQYQ